MSTVPSHFCLHVALGELLPSLLALRIFFRRCYSLLDCHGGVINFKVFYIISSQSGNVSLTAGCCLSRLQPAGRLAWCCGRSPPWPSSLTRACPTSKCCVSSWREDSWISRTTALTCCESDPHTCVTSSPFQTFILTLSRSALLSRDAAAATAARFAVLF